MPLANGVVVNFQAGWRRLWCGSRGASSSDLLDENVADQLDVGDEGTTLQPVTYLLMQRPALPVTLFPAELDIGAS